MTLLSIASSISLNVQDAESAEAVLETVYRQYGHDGKAPDLWKPTTAAFHSSLVRLLRADEMANGSGQAGPFDGDPICSCEDWGGIYDLRIDVKPPTGGRTQALVSSYLLPRSNRQPRTSEISRSREQPSPASGASGTS